MVMQGHAVADAELPDPGPDFGDDARRFVSEDARRGHGAVLDFLDVGGANAATATLTSNSPRWMGGTGTVSRRRSFGAAIDDGAHERGDGDGGWQGIPLYFKSPSSTAMAFSPFNSSTLAVILARLKSLSSSPGTICRVRPSLRTGKEQIRPFSIP